MSGNGITWIMLNPSTADETQDDPTIRRCTNFAKAWGAWQDGPSSAHIRGPYRYDLRRGNMRVVNLFAWRATDPRELAKVADPIGPCNDSAIIDAAHAAALVVCAWGVRGELHGRGEKVRVLLGEEGITPHYLRLSTGGSPTHPLYLPGNLVPVRWTYEPTYHYRRAVQPGVIDAADMCRGAMQPVFSEGAALIGYRCGKCNTTASPDGRTEYGP